MKRDRHVHTYEQERDAGLPGQNYCRIIRNRRNFAEERDEEENEARRCDDVKNGTQPVGTGEDSRRRRTEKESDTQVAKGGGW